MILYVGDYQRKIERIKKILGKDKYTNQKSDVATVM